MVGSVCRGVGGVRHLWGGPGRGLAPTGSEELLVFLHDHVPSSLLGVCVPSCSVKCKLALAAPQL